MVEEVFELTKGDDRVVERILFDDNVHYLHMILRRGEALPVHYSNSNVYMTCVRGRLSINLNDQGIHEYPRSTMLKIPNKTKMHILNMHEDPLELIVVKAPAPTEPISLAT